MSAGRCSHPADPGYGRRGATAAAPGEKRQNYRQWEKRFGQVSALSQTENTHFGGFGIGWAGSAAHVHHHCAFVFNRAIPVPRRTPLTQIFGWLRAEGNVSLLFQSRRVAIATNGTLERLLEGHLFYPYSSSTLKNLSIFSSNLRGFKKMNFKQPKPIVVF